jgi:hypothetical protein
MSNEPVAWLVQYKGRHEFRWSKPDHLFEALACEPLYAYTDQMGLAESIVKQQALEIASLKDKLLLAKQSIEILEGWIKK